MARVTHAAPHLPLAEVKNRMRTDPRVMSRQRWLIIYNALVEPRSAEEIARHCGVSKATVHAVISRYNRLGVAALETPGKGGRRRQYLTLEEEKEFLAPFFAQAERGEIATVGQIWHAYAQRIGHEVDDSTIYRLLHRHGWRKLMPRPKHPKADLQVQEQFKKTFPCRWKQRLQREKREMNVPSCLWRKMKAVLAVSVKSNAAGLRLVCVPPFQVVREYVYVYAAVAPVQGQMVSLILPEASTAMMNLFLEQVSQAFPGHFIIMQVDQAGWHRSQELAIPANIRLIPQPAYSPEVNPVEHVWDELREKYVHNRIFPSLDALIEVLCQGLIDLAVIYRLKITVFQITCHEAPRLQRIGSLT